MPGPHPLPTALHAARGYPRHRKKNHAEPIAPRLTPSTPPPYLTPAAALIWQELAPVADRVGVLDQLGARIFATACRLQALGEAHLAARGAGKPKSGPEPSLWAGVKCLDKAAGFWARFGLDPASRTRLHVGGTEGETDELAAFRPAHPRRAAAAAGRLVRRRPNAPAGLTAGSGRGRETGCDCAAGYDARRRRAGRFAGAGSCSDFVGRRLRQLLPSEARLERRDQVGRRGPGLDLDALDLLAGDLLLDRLQEPLPVLVLVVLGMELGRGELADQSLGERPLLVADLRLGAPVDLGRVVDLAREVEPLEEEPVLVHGGSRSASSCRAR